LDVRHHSSSRSYPTVPYTHSWCFSNNRFRHLKTDQLLSSSLTRLIALAHCKESNSCAGHTTYQTICIKAMYVIVQLKHARLSFRARFAHGVIQSLENISPTVQPCNSMASCDCFNLTVASGDSGHHATSRSKVLQGNLPQILQRQQSLHS